MNNIKNKVSNITNYINLYNLNNVFYDNKKNIYEVKIIYPYLQKINKYEYFKYHNIILKTKIINDNLFFCSHNHLNYNIITVFITNIRNENNKYFIDNILFYMKMNKIFNMFSKNIWINNNIEIKPEFFIKNSYKKIEINNFEVEKLNCKIKNKIKYFNLNQQKLNDYIKNLK